MAEKNRFTRVQILRQNNIYMYVEGFSAVSSQALRIDSINDDIQTLLKNGYICYLRLLSVIDIESIEFIQCL